VQCLDYNQSGSSSNLSTTAGASGSVSALGGGFTSEFADLNSTDGKLDIRGVPQSACFGY